MSGPAAGWAGRSVLVTGCSGFVGSWLVRRLVELGARVVGLLRDQDPDSLLSTQGLDRDICLVRGRLEDYRCLLRALHQYDVERVFHLGAQAVVGSANRDPLSTFESNIRGTWHVLEACRQAPQVRALVVASSDKAYGTGPALPCVEQMPLQGEHPYDVSKSCADLLARSYHHTFGLPVGVIRWGNTYGGGDLSFSRLIPDVIRHLLHQLPPVIRSNGTFVRDYLYIDDAVEAYLAVAEALVRGEAVGEAFNIGSGEQHGVLDVTERIQRLMSCEELTPIILDRATGEITEQYLSIDKAREQLGWEPRFDLDTGLQRTIAWYRDLFADEAMRLRYGP